mgnify:CR=1 FL=1
MNLERALRFCDRLGGHIVLGHVDFTGRILSSEKEGIALNLTFSAEEKYMKYILEKGSVAVDGVSLTVAKRGDSSFMISLIPHTGSLTVLSAKRIGEPVNIECDYLGKYIEQLMQKEHEGVTTKRFKGFRVWRPLWNLNLIRLKKLWRKSEQGQYCHHAGSC